jgi:hypothetical protein
MNNKISGLDNCEIGFAAPAVQDISNMEIALQVTGSESGVTLDEPFNADTMEYNLNAVSVHSSIIIYIKAPVEYATYLDGILVMTNYDIPYYVEKISPDSKIVILLVCPDGSKLEYTIHIYSRHLPSFCFSKTEFKAFQEGFYYCSIDSFLLRFNTKGDLVYYRGFRHLGGHGISHFRPVRLQNGEVRYTYFVEVDTALRGNNGSYRSGMHVIMDGKFLDIRCVILRSFGWHNENYLDSHEFLLLSDEHWISLAYIGRIVDNLPVSLKSGRKAHVQSCIVQEVRNDEVILEFETVDNPCFYEAAQEENNYDSEQYQDYVHINSVCIDQKDGNLIVSMRNQYAIYKISRVTGKILWTLGGKQDMFGLDSGQGFVGQHSAYCTRDGRILLFNNNSFKGQTKIMEYWLDEEKLKLRFLKSYSVADRTTHYGGSVFESGSGTHIISWGMCLNQKHPVFCEVDPFTGQEIVVLSGYFDNPKIHCGSYRVFKSNF